MSDTSSCPNDKHKVGDRQVDVLAGFVLRTDLGTSQPSADVWDRLQTRMLLGDAPVAPPVLTKPLATKSLETTPLALPLGLRVQHALLTTVPRISSVGAALALFIMFVNSSLSLMMPGAFNGPAAAIIHPADPTAFVMQKLDARNPSADHQDEWYDQPIILRMSPIADESPAVTFQAEDPSTLVPPQSISQNELTAWAGLPNQRNYDYVGKQQR